MTRYVRIEPAPEAAQVLVTIGTKLIVCDLRAGENIDVHQMRLANVRLHAMQFLREQSRPKVDVRIGGESLGPEASMLWLREARVH